MNKQGHLTESRAQQLITAALKPLKQRVAKLEKELRRVKSDNTNLKGQIARIKK